MSSKISSDKSSALFDKTIKFYYITGLQHNFNVRIDPFAFWTSIIVFLLFDFNLKQIMDCCTYTTIGLTAKCFDAMKNALFFDW